MKLWFPDLPTFTNLPNAPTRSSASETPEKETAVPSPQQLSSICDCCWFRYCFGGCDCCVALIARDLVVAKKSRYAGSTRSLMDKRISNRIGGKSKRMSVGHESGSRDNAEKNIRLMLRCRRLSTSLSEKLVENGGRWY